MRAESPCVRDERNSHGITVRCRIETPQLSSTILVAAATTVVDTPSVQIATDRCPATAAGTAMHRANVVIGSGGGRRSTVVVEESDATASSTYVGGVDGRDDDFVVDDGVNEASPTTTMIYVKEECGTIDDGEDSSHLLSLQQQHDDNEIEDVSTYMTILYTYCFKLLY